MNFNRIDGSAYSPIEAAILRQLGCTSFEFMPLSARAGRPAPPVTAAGPEEEQRVLSQLEALGLDWASAGMRRRSSSSSSRAQGGELHVPLPLPPRVWASIDDDSSEDDEGESSVGPRKQQQQQQQQQPAKL